MVIFGLKMIVKSSLDFYFLFFIYFLNLISTFMLLLPNKAELA